MKFKDKKPALILIDIQKGFLEEKSWGGNRNNKDAELICGKILNRWRKMNLPLFHVRHSSVNPQSPLHKSHEGFEFNEHMIPQKDEPVITKQVNSAFIGTDLKERLDKLRTNTLVIAGLTTNHCISTTARMAGNYGYATYVISDATATFDRTGINGEKYNAETIHLTSLASLSEEFATIWDSEKLMHELEK